MQHQYPDFIVYAIPFFLLLMGIEFYINYKEKRDLYLFKDSISSISMGLGSMVVDIFTKFVYATFFIYLYQFRLFDLGNSWWVWILLLFVEDFVFYWRHRIGHEVRFFWASHSVHHSSQMYNLSTALRQEWSGRIFSLGFYMVLPLLGFHPLMIIVVSSISLIYQYWIHTQIVYKFPYWFEFFMNTPSHHRVHHATNTLYLDKNHAGIFIIWDKLFGTFQEEIPNEKPIYGLTKNIASYQILDIASFEWMNLWKDFSQKGIHFKDRLLYLLNPPGWKHDGTGLTTKDLQAKL